MTEEEGRGEPRFVGAARASVRLQAEGPDECPTILGADVAPVLLKKFNVDICQS